MSPFVGFNKVSDGCIVCAVGKALSKLSFGDEAEEDEGELAMAREQLRFRSAHETLTDDARLEQVAPGAHDGHVAAIRERLAQEQV